MVDQPAFASKASVALVEASGAGRRRPSRRDWLFRGLSVKVHAGEHIGIGGSMGSGKTLLLRSLSLLDPLDAGEILWLGKAVSAEMVPAFRRQVIYLHQRPVLFPGTVEENLRQPFAAKIHRRARFDRDRAVQWLERVGRDDSFLARPHRDLSGGEQQILALLRAMQLDPAVLLLDEPTAALDPENAHAIESMVRSWLSERRGERATIWVGHDLDQLRRFATRMLSIRGGQLVEWPPS